MAFALAVIAPLANWPASPFQAPIAAAAEPTVPAGFDDQVLWSGLGRPTVVDFAADGHVFVAEKSGVIDVFDSISDKTPSVFADLRTDVHDYWDRGLLGMAVDPQFPARPYVYALYTYNHILGDPAAAPRWADTCPNPPGVNTDGCVVSGRLERLTAGGSPLQVTSRKVLIEDFCQQFPSHSIGTVRVGPEGALYLSAGEGANFNSADYGQFGGTKPDTTNPVIPKNPCGDPPGGVNGAMTSPTAEGGALRSQDIRSPGDPVGLDGTILRVDPDTGAGWPTNANANNLDSNARRIIAYGLRNPYRFTIHPDTGALWIGDVGDGTWEEINELPSPTSAAKNFGWPCYEGSAVSTRYNPLGLDLCTSLTAGNVSMPFFKYDHGQEVVNGDGCGTGSSAIAGLTFLPADAAVPAVYQGALFFTDVTRRCIWYLPLGQNGRPTTTPVKFADLRVGDGKTQGAVFLTTEPGGDLVYTDYDHGDIHKIDYTGTNRPPDPSFTATPSSGPAPLQVHLDASGSSDPDSDPLTFAWDLDDDGQYDDATGMTADHTFPDPGDATVGLQVTDLGGASATTTRTVAVDNVPPEVTMVTPQTDLTWDVGDDIGFSATATDPQDGALPASAFSWELDIEHCPSNCHTHEVETFDGVDHGSFSAPDHSYPSHLVLSVTVTDSGGLKTTVSRDLDPNTGTVKVQANVPSATLTVGSASGTPPAPGAVIIGGQESVAAVQCVKVGSTTWTFKSWSDGGARVHDVTGIDGTLSLTATYATNGAVCQTPFTDIASSSFVNDIIWAWDEDITVGCSPILYCPAEAVTRGQMATFLVRALDLPSTSTDYFTDDDGTTHEANINRLRAAGITNGCTPTKYCPDRPVTRAEMASFLRYAFHLPATANDYFTDDDGTTHETSINRLRAAGITTGCTPTTYCPTVAVTRAQMAAFLHRAMR